MLLSVGLGVGHHHAGADASVELLSEPGGWRFGGADVRMRMPAGWPPMHASPVRLWGLIRVWGLIRFSGMGRSTATGAVMLGAVCICLAAGIMSSGVMAQELPALPDDIQIDAARFERIGRMARVIFIYGGILAVVAGVGIAVLTLRHRRALADIENLAERESRRAVEIEQAHRHASEGEAQLRAVLDNMIDCVLTVDEAGRIRSCNPAVERLFARTGAALTGTDITLLLAPEDRVILSAAFSGGKAGGVDIPDGFRREVKGIAGDGRIVHLEVSISQMQLGEERQFIVMLRNISLRKVALAKVSEAEERLVRAINALPDGFVLFDADDRLVVCNDKYREIYKTSGDIIQVGTTFEDMLRAGLERGQYADAVGNEEPWVAERLRKHRAATGIVEQRLGDGRWLRIFEQRTPDGGIVGFRVDITELKQREAALQRSENLLRATVFGAIDGIIVVDEAGLIITFNPAAEAIFGYSADEARGVNVFDLLLSEPLKSQYQRGFVDYLETGHGPLLRRRTEIECCRKDGSPVLVEAAVDVSESAGERLYITNVRDIAEEKARALALEDARDRAEVASRAKASFLAMMSHEIRTPLNGVLGLLGLLGETDLSDQQAGYVRTASESGYSLLAIINDILVFSKLEAGKLDLEPTTDSLYRLLEGICALMEPRAREKGLTLELTIAPETPDIVRVDGGRLRQVLLNLIGNALKFTQKGTVSVSLSRVESGALVEGEPGRVRFAVRDTGIGIPAEKISDVFAEFATLDVSYSRRYEGTGLGLAISRELVSLMGGRIEVESVEGEGSLFRFDLELAASRSGTMIVDTQLPDPQALAAVDGMRVLLAEDNATNQMVLCEILRAMGVSVSIASTGREAVDKARVNTFDAILMDISMPEMDGVEATGILRDLPEPCATIPIIALTAHAMAEDRERALANRMDGFLSKPVSKRDLVQALAGVLKKGGAETGRLRSMATEARVPKGSPEGLPEGLPGALLKEHAVTDETDDKASNDGATPQEAGNLIIVEDTDVLDTAVLAALLSDLPDALRGKVMVQFEEDARLRMTQITDGMAQRDLDVIGAATHVLTSLLGTFGALGASELSTDINQKIRTGASFEQLGAVPDLLDQTEAAVAAVLHYNERKFATPSVAKSTAGDR